ncbi:MAG TPA: phosphatase PAP2 family protein [Dehalococcoidia bacterium]|nr:phosphatase PAP2 family protein [Dehalococcoidia bacterium]
MARTTLDPRQRKSISHSRLIAGWLAILAAFVALGVYAGTRTSPGLDLEIARAVQRLPSFAGSALDVANFLGGGWPSGSITALFALAFLLERRPLEAVLFGLTGVPRFMQSLVKELVEAPRPRVDQLHVQHILGSYSYPSGHVVGATVVWGLAFALAPLLPIGPRGVVALRCLCVVMIVAMGLARIWAGAHWPTDVTGGYLFGVLWLIPEFWLYRRWRQRDEAAPAS